MENPNLTRGGLIKSESCPRCYVDKETKILIPCKDHEPKISRPRKQKDISLPLDLKYE